MDGSNTLILALTNLLNKAISDKLLLDDPLLKLTGGTTWCEVSAAATISTSWVSTTRRVPRSTTKSRNMRASSGMGGWMHINSMSALGPNKWWYDAGVRVFIPTTRIWDARESQHYRHYRQTERQDRLAAGPGLPANRVETSAGLSASISAYDPAGATGARAISHGDFPIATAAGPRYGAPNPASADG